MKVLAALVCGFLCLSALCRAEEGKRIALVIGNDAYTMRPLQNAVNDARAMAHALQDAGFRVVVKENATREQMEEASVEMLGLLGPDDTAMIFYAGHAVQIENENFLIPVDFQQASSVIAAKYKAFSLAKVLDELVRIRHKRTIVVLDACRSNPVAEGQSLQAGLALPMTDSKETYIAFSTSPNHVATDNPNGRDSYFTEALADLIENGKDLPIDDVMTRVRKRVETATDGKQTPWSQSSLSSKFFFHPLANAVAETDVTMVDQWLGEAKKREARGDWGEALRLYLQVVAKKPGGLAESEANRCIPYVTARRDAQASYDAGKYAEAAAAYKHAYEMDPFFSEPALQAIDCYLLADDLDHAVDLLHQVRLRGATADIDRTELFLKALAPVDEKAGAELQAGVPPPPSIRELFPGFAFGRVEVDKSLVLARTSRTDAASQLLAALPTTPVPAATMIASVASTPATEAAGSSTPLTIESLHLEVLRASTSQHRDLSIERVNTAAVNRPGVQREGTPLKVTTDPPGAMIQLEGDPGNQCESPCLLTVPAAIRTLQVSLDGYKPETRDISNRTSGEPIAITLEQQFGFVAFDGPSGSTPVYVDGKLAAAQIPQKIRMPAGSYHVRLVDHGKILTETSMEVKDSALQVFKVPQQQQAKNE